MDAIAASHLQILGLNASLVARAFEGVSDDDRHRAPEPHGNSMIWIAGHLAAMRLGMIGLVGGKADRPAWTALFARGAAPPARDAYPPSEELVAAFAATVPALASALEAMTEAQWAAPSPRSFPVPDRSMRGALAFFAFHETYHVGQLAYLRTWLGHSALAG